MREPIRDRGRLEHILNAIEIIQERSRGMSYDELVADKILFGGLVYYTMIVGEAAYKLSKAFVERNPQVNWKELSDMRHHLVHGYYQIDSSILWDVIQDDLTPLRQQVEKILAETDWSEWENEND